MTAEIIDAANELAQLRIDQAVANMRIDHNAVSSLHCEACGCEIPEKRRELVRGCTTCIDCQSLIEMKLKQRGM